MYDNWGLVERLRDLNRGVIRVTSGSIIREAADTIENLLIQTNAQQGIIEKQFECSRLMADRFLDMDEEIGRLQAEVARLNKENFWLSKPAEGCATGNKVPYEERKAVYEAALKKWGAQAQSMMAVEEMSELTKEICKLGRGKNDMEAFADEVADVTIMLEQLRLIYGINALVCEHMDAKVRRLKERLDDKEC